VEPVVGGRVAGTLARGGVPTPGMAAVASAASSSSSSTGTSSMMTDSSTAVAVSGRRGSGAAVQPTEGPGGVEAVRGGRAPAAGSGAAVTGSGVGGRVVPGVEREEEVEGVEERVVAGVANSADGGRADRVPPPRVWAMAGPSTRLALRAPSGGAWVRWVAGFGPGSAPPVGTAAAAGEAAPGDPGAGAGSGAEASGAGAGGPVRGEEGVGEREWVGVAGKESRPGRASTTPITANRISPFPGMPRRRLH
jgi:hypothetical protein